MELMNNETLIKDGKANLKKSTFNSAGGHLYLTNKRLVFEAHGFNFGGKTKVDLEINQLVRCQSASTKLISNEIEVYDKYHNNYIFVVYDRNVWTNEIENQIVLGRHNNTVKIENNPVKRQSEISDLDRLKKLKELWDLGAITEAEYVAKKNEILKRI